MFPGFRDGFRGQGGNAVPGTERADAVGLFVTHGLNEAAVGVKAFVVDFAVNAFRHEALFPFEILRRQDAADKVRFKEHGRQEFGALPHEVLAVQGEAAVNHGHGESDDVVLPHLVDERVQRGAVEFGQPLVQGQHVREGGRGPAEQERQDGLRRGFFRQREDEIQAEAAGLEPVGLITADLKTRQEFLPFKGVFHRGLLLCRNGRPAGQNYGKHYSKKPLIRKGLPLVRRRLTNDRFWVRIFQIIIRGKA